MIKKAVKIIVDTAMFILLLLLMEEHLISDGVHEWLGLVIFVLFALHNALNYRWYKVLFKGKYTALRIVQTVFNFLLIVVMLACIVSSVLISETVFSYLHLLGAEVGRRLHMLSTAWTFVLMSVHLGLHWGGAVSKANRIGVFSLLAERIAWRLTVSSVCVFGVAVFVQRAFYEELLLLTQFKNFDYNKTAFVYFLETAAMATVFVAAAYYIKKLGLTIQKYRKEKK